MSGTHQHSQSNGIRTGSDKNRVFAVRQESVQRFHSRPVTRSDRCPNSAELYFYLAKHSPSSGGAYIAASLISGCGDTIFPNSCLQSRSPIVRVGTKHPATCISTNALRCTEREKEGALAFPRWAPKAPCYPLDTEQLSQYIYEAGFILHREEAHQCCLCVFFTGNKRVRMLQSDWRKTSSRETRKTYISHMTSKSLDKQSFSQYIVHRDALPKFSAGGYLHRPITKAWLAGAKGSISRANKI